MRAVALSPRGFPADFSQVAGFFAEVGGVPDSGVVFNGAWLDSPGDGSRAGRVPEAAALVMKMAGAHGYTPVIVFGWRSDQRLHLRVPADATNDWTNAAARAAFNTMLLDFVGSYRPPFLFLGNENDFYYQQDSADYQNWVAFYDEAYAAIKARSPETRVGPVFNYEHLAGLGRLAGHTEPQWAALSAHDLSRVDVVGLSLYPWLQFASPGEVAADYLAPLLDRIGDTPIVITETGWPAERPSGFETPWEVSAAAQVTYLQQLQRMLAGKNVPVVAWLYLHPIAGWQTGSQAHQLFGSVSLYDAAGARRPAYDAWWALLP